jgi:hypothetical protein
MSAAVSYPLAGGNLGSNLVLSTYNITGTGNINISGTITSSGAISSSASVSAPTVSSNNYFTSNDIGFNIFTTVGNDLSIRSSRGTELVKESVQAGDAVGSFTTRGWVQSKNDFVLASGIASQLDATANLTTDFQEQTWGLFLVITLVVLQDSLLHCAMMVTLKLHHLPQLVMQGLDPIHQGQMKVQLFSIQLLRDLWDTLVQLAAGRH